MTKSFGKVSILCSLLLILVCCETKPTPPAAPKKGDFSYANQFLDWAMQRLISQNQVPGAAVAVISESDILFQKTYGVSDLQTRRPITKRTFFRAGSLTKILTALAIMRLKEQNLLELDRPLSYYLPEFSIKYHPPRQNQGPDTGVFPHPTVRMFLSHTSGLFSDYFDGAMGEERLNSAELLTALKDEYLCFQPGSTFLYSNTGYELLGILIERISGKPYHAYIKTEILKPLGMEESSIGLQEGQLEQLATGHLKKGLAALPFNVQQVEPVEYLEIRDTAAGSLVTNLEDLIKLLYFLLANKDNYQMKIISEQSFQEMQKSQWQENLQSVIMKTNYGLGLMRDIISFKEDSDWLGHSGNINGFHSLLFFSPQAKLGLVLLTNSSSTYLPSYALVSRALKYYLEAQLGQPVTPDDFTSSLREEIANSSEGYYGFLGIVFEVNRKGQELSLNQPYLKLDFLLKKDKRGLYNPLYKLFGLIPLEIAQNLKADGLKINFHCTALNTQALELWLYAGYARLRFSLPKIEKKKTPPGLRQFLGHYRLVQTPSLAKTLELYLPSKNFLLKEESGWLILQAQDLSIPFGLVLIPESENQAVLAGSNETILFKPEGLYLLGLKAERISKK